MLYTTNTYNIVNSNLVGTKWNKKYRCWLSRETDSGMTFILKCLYEWWIIGWKRPDCEFNQRKAKSWHVQTFSWKCQEVFAYKILELRDIKHYQAMKFEVSCVWMILNEVITRRVKVNQSKKIQYCKNLHYTQSNLEAKIEGRRERERKHLMGSKENIFSWYKTK